MAQAAINIQNDLEQLRRRFDEFRSTQPLRSRLPEPLWTAAAELATRCGVHATARTLRLDYKGLKKRVENRDQPKQKRAAARQPTFVELVGPALGAVTHCSMEVESTEGSKLRLELKAIATAELVNLIRAFVGH
jgi:hypothetical protein